MARYTGPVCRLCRRYGDKLYLKGERFVGPKCAFERRPSAPGQPKFGRRRRPSDRAARRSEPLRPAYRSKAGGGSTSSRKPGSKKRLKRAGALGKLTRNR